jgi:tetratricopeptide (TPR) repeat protein
MPDVHLPQLDEHEETDGRAASTSAHQPRGQSLFKIGLEVVMISAGVFLGLAGEQWRESARHRELAEASLRRFRSEILTNRKAVAAVKDYHITTKKSIDTYLAADPKSRQSGDVSVKGLQPVYFEHSAWDLTLATQSLVYIDSQLAFAISRIYTTQANYADLTRGIMQALYLRPPNENLAAFLSAVAIYYADIVIFEPQLQGMYDEALAQIDRALGESPAETTSPR